MNKIGTLTNGQAIAKKFPKFDQGQFTNFVTGDDMANLKR